MLGHALNRSFSVVRAFAGLFSADAVSPELAVVSANSLDVFEQEGPPKRILHAPLFDLVDNAALLPPMQLADQTLNRNLILLVHSAFTITVVGFYGLRENLAFSVVYRGELARVFVDCARIPLPIVKKYRSSLSCISLADDSCICAFVFREAPFLLQQVLFLYLYTSRGALRVHAGFARRNGRANPMVGPDPEAGEAARGPDNREADVTYCEFLQPPALYERTGRLILPLFLLKTTDAIYTFELMRKEFFSREPARADAGRAEGPSRPRAVDAVFTWFPEGVLLEEGPYTIEGLATDSLVHCLCYNPESAGRGAERAGRARSSSIPGGGARERLPVLFPLLLVSPTSVTVVFDLTRQKTIPIGIAAVEAGGAADGGRGGRTPRGELHLSDPLAPALPPAGPGDARAAGTRQLGTTAPAGAPTDPAGPGGPGNFREMQYLARPLAVAQLVFQDGLDHAAASNTQAVASRLVYSGPSDVVAFCSFDDGSVVRVEVDLVAGGLRAFNLRKALAEAPPEAPRPVRRLPAATSLCALVPSEQSALAGRAVLFLGSQTSASQLRVLDGARGDTLHLLSDLVLNCCGPVQSLSRLSDGTVVAASGHGRDGMVTFARHGALMDCLLQAELRPGAGRRADRYASAGADPPCALSFRRAFPFTPYTLQGWQGGGEGAEQVEGEGGGAARDPHSSRDPRDRSPSTSEASASARSRGEQIGGCGPECECGCAAGAYVPARHRAYLIEHYRSCRAGMGADRGELGLAKTHTSGAAPSGPESASRPEIQLSLLSYHLDARNFSLRPISVEGGDPRRGGPGASPAAPPAAPFTGQDIVEAFVHRGVSVLVCQRAVYAALLCTGLEHGSAGDVSIHAEPVFALPEGESVLCVSNCSRSVFVLATGRSLYFLFLQLQAGERASPLGVSCFLLGRADCPAPVALCRLWECREPALFLVSQDGDLLLCPVPRRRTVQGEVVFEEPVPDFTKLSLGAVLTDAVFYPRGVPDPLSEENLSADAEPSETSRPAVLVGVSGDARLHSVSLRLECRRGELSASIVSQKVLLSFWESEAVGGAILRPISLHQLAAQNVIVAAGRFMYRLELQSAHACHASFWLTSPYTQYLTLLPAQLPRASFDAADSRPGCDGAGAPGANAGASGGGNAGASSRLGSANLGSATTEVDWKLGPRIRSTLAAPPVANKPDLREFYMEDVFFCVSDTDFDDLRTSVSSSRGYATSWREETPGPEAAGFSGAPAHGDSLWAAFLSPSLRPAFSRRAMLLGRTPTLVRTRYIAEFGHVAVATEQYLGKMQIRLVSTQTGIVSNKILLPPCCVCTDFGFLRLGTGETLLVASAFTGADIANLTLKSHSGQPGRPGAASAVLEEDAPPAGAGGPASAPTSPARALAHALAAPRLMFWEVYPDMRVSFRGIHPLPSVCHALDTLGDQLCCGLENRVIRYAVGPPPGLGVPEAGGGAGGGTAGDAGLGAECDGEEKCGSEGQPGPAGASARVTTAEDPQVYPELDPGYQDPLRFYSPPPAFPGLAAPAAEAGDREDEGSLELLALDRPFAAAHADLPWRFSLGGAPRRAPDPHGPRRRELRLTVQRTAELPFHGLVESLQIFARPGPPRGSGGGAPAETEHYVLVQVRDTVALLDWSLRLLATDLHDALPDVKLVAALPYAAPAGTGRCAARGGPAPGAADGPEKGRDKGGAPEGPEGLCVCAVTHRNEVRVARVRREPPGDGGAQEAQGARGAAWAFEPALRVRSRYDVSCLCGATERAGRGPPGPGAGPAAGPAAGGRPLCPPEVLLLGADTGAIQALKPHPNCFTPNLQSSVERHADGTGLRLNRAPAPLEEDRPGGAGAPGAGPQVPYLDGDLLSEYRLVDRDQQDMIAKNVIVNRQYVLSFLLRTELGLLGVG